MKPRVVGITLSLGIIAVAAITLFFVSQIVHLGGPSYRWEYSAPVLFLLCGIGLLIFWIMRTMMRGHFQ